MNFVLTALAQAGQSLPVFWFGLLFIPIFSVSLQAPGGWAAAARVWHVNPRAAAPD